MLKFPRVKWPTVHEVLQRVKQNSLKAAKKQENAKDFPSKTKKTRRKAAKLPRSSSKALRNTKRRSRSFRKLKSFKKVPKTSKGKTSKSSVKATASEETPKAKAVATPCRASALRKSKKPPTAPPQPKERPPKQVKSNPKPADTAADAVEAEAPEKACKANHC